MDLSRSLWIDRAVLLLCLLPAAACKFKGVTSNVASTSSQAYDFSGYCDTKIAAQCSQAVSIDGQNNLAVYRTKPIDQVIPMKRLQVS